MKRNLPGTIRSNRGRWSWAVRLPGEDKRRTHALRLSPDAPALPDSVPIEVARNCAWRMLQDAEAKHGVAPARDSSGACTVAQAVARYLVVAGEYYARTRGRQAVEAALRRLALRYGSRPLAGLSCPDLLDVRDSMVADGFARITINNTISTWRGWARWCHDTRLCSAATMQELVAVQALKRGRTRARDSEPTKPVPHWIVKRTMAGAPPTLRAMVAVQELSGMRTGELVQMRGADLERRGRLLLYRPGRHKNAWRGQFRVVVLGPRAQRVLAPYLSAPPDAPLFSPARCEAERLAAQRVASPTPRRTPLGQRKQGSRRRPGAEWTVCDYAKAVQRWSSATHAADESVPEWRPYQLRSACGTRVRAWFGLEAARAVLGHSMRGGVTDRYTREAMERETIRTAERAALALG